MIEIKDTNSCVSVDQPKALLGGATFVAVVQATDLRNCDDLAERLNRTSDLLTSADFFLGSMKSE